MKSSISGQDCRLRLALLAVLSLGRPVFAATHYVSPSGLHLTPFTNWVDAATNIQMAINACQFGDAVVITDGVYVLTSTLNVTNDVTLRSENGRQAVLINGNAPILGSDAVLLNFGVLDGLTISNAGRHGVKSEYGAVYNCLITHSASVGIDSYTTPRLVTNSSLFVTNTIVRKSGTNGIFTCAVNTRISDCIITESGSSGVYLRQNDAAGAGAIQIPRVSNFVLRASLISSNSNSGVALGVYYYDPANPVIPILIEDCLIEDNVGGRGGGVADSFKTASDASSGAVLSRCTIRRNTADNGGGVYLRGDQQPRIRNSLVVDNRATLWGGGVYLSAGVMENCYISGNHAGDYGGGVYFLYQTSSKAQNCTIVGNTASNGGGTVWGLIQNSIVYNNEAIIQGANYYGGSFLYSCTTPSPGGSGNLVAEPGLLGPSNPHIAAVSPCIDAGSMALALGDLDFDGEPRIWGEGVDIGCDEYYPPGLTGALSVALSADFDRAVVGFTVAFGVAIEGKAEEFRLNFGDGQIVSNTLAVTHAFGIPGIYDAILTAWNGDGTASATTTVQVFSGYTNYVSLSGGHAFPYTNWPAAATTLQAAVAANIPGGMVVADDGVYDSDGAVVLGDLTNRVVLTNGVTMRSLHGPSAAIVMGQGPNGADAVRCAYVGGNSRLEGFTLINGHTHAGSGLAENRVNGGGILVAGNGVVSNCVITGNSAYGLGGGAWGGVLHNCTLSTNSAMHGGGMAGSSLYDGVLVGNTVVSNGGGAYGGTLQNCLVMDNQAQYGGGTALSTNAHCTIARNTAAVSGGGVYRSTVRNSVVYHNTALSSWPEFFNSICTYTCTRPDPAGTGSITNDPLFVDLGGGDFHLDGASPCVDVALGGGSPVIALDGIPRPLDGNDDGSAVADMGAYEFVNDLADTDEDGLSDSNELYAVGTSLVTWDTDGDAQSDGEEIVAGFNPLDRDSFFFITRMASSGASAPVFYWTGFVGRLYTVRATSDLEQEMTNLPAYVDQPGFNGVMSFTNATPSEFDFYGIRVRLAP